MKNRSKRAFTLIELIIVIVVLGILATIAIVGYKAVIDRTNQSSATAAAQSFDRQIRSMAGSGDTVNNNPNDNDPRKPELLLEMLAKGDVPDGDIGTTSLRNNNLRVLVYQSGGTLAGTWTRLVCPGSPCSGVNYASSSDSLISAATPTPVAGRLLNPTRTNPAGSANPSPICIQFHKAGQDAFLSISSSANTAGTISSSIATACPTAAYGGTSSTPVAASSTLTPSTTTGGGRVYYTDLSTSTFAGYGAIDGTW